MKFEHLWILGQNASGTVDEPNVVIPVRAMDGPRASLEGIKENVHVRPVSHPGILPHGGEGQHTIPTGRHPFR